MPRKRADARDIKLYERSGSTMAGHFPSGCHGEAQIVSPLSEKNKASQDTTRVARADMPTRGFGFALARASLSFRRHFVPHKGTPAVLFIRGEVDRYTKRPSQNGALEGIIRKTHCRVQRRRRVGGLRSVFRGHGNLVGGSVGNGVILMGDAGALG
jgi:hypothetical protein